MGPPQGESAPRVGLISIVILAREGAAGNQGTLCETASFLTLRDFTHSQSHSHTLTLTHTHNHTHSLLPRRKNTDCGHRNFPHYEWDFTKIARVLTAHFQKFVLKSTERTCAFSSLENDPVAGSYSLQGYSKSRTHTALGHYGSSLPRSIGPSSGRCVSLISSNPCSAFLKLRTITSTDVGAQGYLTHMKTPPPRTLQ